MIGGKKAYPYRILVDVGVANTLDAELVNTDLRVLAGGVIARTTSERRSSGVL